MGLIQDIADLAPAKTQPPARRAQTRTFGLRIPGASPSNYGSQLDVPRYLQARGVEYRTKDVSGGVAYLVTCPFDSNHGGNGESAVFQGDDGKLTFDCKHNSCQGRRWSDFRDAIGKPDSDHYDPPLNSRPTSGTEKPTASAPDRQEPIQFARISSAELAGGDYSLSYLIEDVLVDQQPGLVAGPQKSLKTNLLIDLSISLAVGGRFLGLFNVPEAVRVGVMSGESGLATLQETARRIARAAGHELATIENLIWSPDLPIFGQLNYMDALGDFIKADGLRVIVIDPAYLCTPLAADKGNNLFAMGELLRSVNDVCQDCGCTLLIAHHMKRTGVAYGPPELADAAWSGWAEWARQWLLLNRREPYDPASNGEHKLWFAVGGSAGHSGLWGLDIEEGRRNAPEGRYWDVSVRPASDVRAEAKEDRQTERRREVAAKFEKDLDNVARALDAHPDGATRTRLREYCGMSGTKFGPVIAELERRGIAEQCEVRVSNHNNPTEGYRRVSDAADSPA